MSEDEEQRLLAACELGDRIHTYTRRHYGKDREVSQTVNSDTPRLKNHYFIDSRGVARC